MEENKTPTGEITLDEICVFAQKSPEQLINMLIAAGKVNRGHYKNFMKMEESEMEAMRHRVRYNELIIAMYETDLKVKALGDPNFPKTVEMVQELWTKHIELAGRFAKIKEESDVEILRARERYEKDEQDILNISKALTSIMEKIAALPERIKRKYQLP